MIILPLKLNKFHKIEVVFFATYFYVFRFLTDLEYNFWEMHQKGISKTQIEHTLVFGSSSLVAFFIFYKGLAFCLKTKNPRHSIVLFITFIVGYTLYQKGVNYIFAHLDFLSLELRQFARSSYKAKALGFSIAYMLREFLAIGSLAFIVTIMKQAEQMKALKEQQLISELTYLKAQLQPHFFFNTLNNIYALALKQSKETAPLVSKLADMMRYILYKADAQMVFLKEEVAFIQNYVEVENIRYRDAIRINFDAQDIDENSRISPLLLLPFIENAFKHGIQEEENAGFVNIVICKTENELTLEVRNSISERKESSTGIGLLNVKKRLDLLYPEKYRLAVQNDGKTYEVSLTLKIG